MTESMKEKKSVVRLLTEILRFFTSLPRASYYLSVLCLIVLVGMLFLEVVVRFIFRTSVIGAVDELGAGIIIVLVLSSFAWIYKEGGHLRVGIVADRIPYKPRRILELVLAIASLAFVFFIFNSWLKMTLLTLESGRPLRLTGIPEWIFQMAGTVAWGVFGIAILEDIVSKIKRIFVKCSNGEDR